MPTLILLALFDLGVVVAQQYSIRLVTMRLRVQIPPGAGLFSSSTIFSSLTFHQNKIIECPKSGPSRMYISMNDVKLTKIPSGLPGEKQALLVQIGAIKKLCMTCE